MDSDNKTALGLLGVTVTVLGVSISLLEIFPFSWYTIGVTFSLVGVIIAMAAVLKTDPPK